MDKPIFSNFRIPAYELPVRNTSHFPIKLSNQWSLPQDIQKTDPKELKNHIKQIKYNYKSLDTSCQVDFQDEFVKQIEKEVLTDHTMNFIEVCDIDVPDIPSQTPNGFYKYPLPKNEFLQVSEISIKPTLSHLPSTTPENPSQMTKEELLKIETEARDPTHEFKQTQDYKINQVRMKLEKLEEDANRLEQEMKSQNENLNKIDLEYAEQADKNRKEIAVKFLNKIESQEDNLDDIEDPDHRISKILANNKDLYDRINRALTPKIVENVEASDKEPVRETNVKSNINPIISKRLSAAMNTAAQAISSSRNHLVPGVMKKPRK
jgi:hypothetical protein